MSDEGRPRFPIPPHSCDCHVHVFDPRRFPYTASRSYTPGTATLDDLIAFERSIGVDRMVLVQPSVYGTDNSCLLAALERLGERARGVAVIDAVGTSEAELDALDKAGIRSVRVNLEAKGHRDPADAGKALSAVAERVAGRGWSVQIYAALPVIVAIKDTIAGLPVDLVVDHFAGARAAGGVEQQGFSSLVAMLETGKVYAKLSAPYRASDDAPGFDDMENIVKALIAAAPDRLVWASDWPHTGGGATGSNERKGRSLDDIEPFRSIDNRAVLSRLAKWCDESAWSKLMSQNPQRLYFRR